MNQIPIKDIDAKELKRKFWKGVIAGILLSIPLWFIVGLILVIIIGSKIG